MKIFLLAVMFLFLSFNETDKNLISCSGVDNNGNPGWVFYSVDLGAWRACSNFGCATVSSEVADALCQMYKQND